jgi:ribonuclease D
MFYDVKIIDDAEVAHAVASEIRQSYAGPVGFDTETELKGNRRSGTMSIIQLYVPWHHRRPVCYIFHLGKMGKEIPQGLKQILTSKHILKAIAAPENDVRWLSSDFGISAAGYIDIQTVAAMQGHDKLGLDNLAKKLLPGWKEKNKDMKYAPWNSTLSAEMIEYAANDAYASLEILRKLSPWFFQIPPPENAGDLADLISKVRAMNNGYEEPEQLTYEEIIRRCDLVLKDSITNPPARKAYSCQLAERVTDGKVQGLA